MTLFNINRSLGRMGIGSLSLPIDTSGLPFNVADVQWSGNGGVVMYNDRPGMDSFVDPSPYEDFVDEWLTAVQGNPLSIPLAQAQQIKIDLANAVYGALTTNPLPFTVTAGFNNWYTTLDKIAQYQAALGNLVFNNLGNFTQNYLTPGTPTLIGTHHTNSGSQSSMTATLTAAIQSGDLVIVAIAYDGTQLITSVSDGTNTYQKIITQTDSTTGSVSFYACVNPTPISSGTVTVTLLTTTSNNTGYTVDVVRIANMAGSVSSPIDQSAGATNAGVLLPPTSQPVEVVLGIGEAISNQASHSFGTPSGWTNINNVSSNSSDTQYTLQYKVLSSIGASWTPTTSSSSYFEALASFKAGLGSVTANVPGSASIMPFGSATPVSLSASDLNNLLSAINTRNSSYEPNRQSLLAAAAAASNISAVIAVKYKKGWPGIMWPGPASMAISPSAAVSGKFWPDPASIALTVS